MRLRTDGRLYDWVDFVFEVNFANIQDFSNQTQDIVVGVVLVTAVAIDALLRQRRRAGVLGALGAGVVVAAWVIQTGRP